MVVNEGVSSTPTACCYRHRAASPTKRREQAKIPKVVTWYGWFCGMDGFVGWMVSWDEWFDGMDGFVGQIVGGSVGWVCLVRRIVDAQNGECLGWW